MTAFAGGCRTLKHIVHVAGCTRDRRMLARQRELRRGGVIEGCSLPLRGCVAQGATLREARGYVIRVRRLLEVWKVAAFTGHGCSLEHVVHMAGRADYRRVFPRKREPRGCVIKLRTLPLRRRVTCFAGLWESGGDVVDALCRLVIVQMAGDAARRKPGELVVDVTGGARHRRVFPREREFRRSVIECRTLPLSCGVAGFAVLREAGGNVIDAFGALVVL